MFMETLPTPRAHHIKLILFDFEASPNSRKVRITLAEKGLEYERQNVDIAKGEQRSTKYLTINPHGRIPSIQHHLRQPDGQISVHNIYDSTIINEYLEESFPDPPLFPRAPCERANARILEDWADNLLIEPVGVLFAQYVFTSESRRNQVKIDQARMRVIELLARLEERLEDRRPYLLNDYSVADIAMTPHLAYAEQFGVPITELTPRVAEWYTRLKNRPSFHA